jgi:hypothetical protein
MKKRKVALSVETERVLVVGEPGGAVTIWCEQCGKMVRAATPSEIATAAGISLESLGRRIREQKLHSVDAGKGLVLVCLKSVSKSS